MKQVFNILGVALGLLLGGAAPAAAQSPDAIFAVKLRNMDVVEALKILAEKGNMNLAISAKVQGRVSLFVEGITVRQALDVLVSSGGLAYMEDQGVIQIMMASEYEQRFGRPFDDRMVVQVFPVQHGQASSLQQIMNLAKSAKGKVNMDLRSNSIIVIDQPEIIQSMGAMLEKLDQPLMVKEIALQYGHAAQAAPTAEKLLSEIGKLQVDAQRNRIIVWDIASKIDRVAAVIKGFDKPTQTQVRSFRLDYAGASEVRTAIEPELTKDVGTILADTLSRSVIVKDLPERLALIEQLIKAMDVRRRQVRIEAKIVQVILKDQYRLGIDWQYVTDKVNGLDISSRLLTLGEGSARTQVQSGTLENDDYTVLLEALEEVGKTNVLSTPRVTVVDGVAAEILVGSTVPYITVNTRESNGILTQFEEVTLVDVGVKLRVTPRISRDGYVHLYVNPEVSAVTTFQQNIPVVETSQAETEVLARDGATVILAGLIEEDRKEIVKGIPLLVRIPLLGKLFSSTDVTFEKSELVFFMTPTIVAGEGDFGGQDGNGLENPAEGRVDQSENAQEIKPEGKKLPDIEPAKGPESPK